MERVIKQLIKRLTVYLDEIISLTTREQKSKRRRNENENRKAKEEETKIIYMV